MSKARRAEQSDQAGHDRYDPDFPCFCKAEVRSGDCFFVRKEDTQAALDNDHSHRNRQNGSEDAVNVARQARSSEQYGENDPVACLNIRVTKHEANAACDQKQNDDHAQRFRTHTMRKAIEQRLTGE